MKTNQCFLWFHNWGKWEVIAEQNYDRTDGYSDKVRAKVIRTVQQRECETCGLKQQRSEQVVY